MASSGEDDSDGLAVGAKLSRTSGLSEVEPTKEDDLGFFAGSDTEGLGVATTMLDVAPGAANGAGDCTALIETDRVAPVAAE